jgi:tetratricopeptide (TPR) repeat protein
MKAVGYAVALCLLFSSSAFAQAPDAAESSKVQASQHFRRGVELFQEEAFRAAMAEFQRAYDIAPDYRLLYNLGQTKLELQDYLGAAQSYERYLAAGYLDISPERRAEVEQALAALRERTASVHIAVNRKGAEVFIDDVKVGVSPIEAVVQVNVGGHRVMARTSYGSTDTEVIDVAGGDTANVTLELAAPAAPTIAALEAKPWNRAERSAVAAWSVSGAVAVGALATGLMANNAQGDLNKLLETRDVTHKSIQNQRDSVHTLAVATDVLIGTSVAAAVAGTVTWLIGHEKVEEPKKAEKPSLANVRVDVGVGSLGLSGRF